MSTPTKDKPLDAIWIRFGNDCITGQWAFEPLPPEMGKAQGIHKFVRDDSADLTALHTETAALRKDEERIDWLEANTPNVMCLATQTPGVVQWEVADYFRSNTLRTAIDAAMSASPLDKSADQVQP